MRSSSSAGMVAGSGVVEERVVQADQRSLSFRLGPLDRFGRELVAPGRSCGFAARCRGGRSAPAGSSGRARPRSPGCRGARHRRRTARRRPPSASMSTGGAAVVGEVRVVHAVERREPARAVTAGHDRGRAVGAACSPGGRCARRSRTPDTGCGRPTAMPSGRGMCGPASQCHGPPSKSARVAPRGVRDHVAVLAEQRLDDLEDARVRDRPAGTRRCG